MISIYTHGYSAEEAEILLETLDECSATLFDKTQCHGMVKECKECKYRKLCDDTYRAKMFLDDFISRKRIEETFGI